MQFLTPKFASRPAIEQIACGRFTAHIYASIADVPKAEWDALATTGSLTFSHAFWQVIERSRLNDFDYYHAMFRDAEGGLAAVVTFYTVTTDLAIFAPRWLRATLAVLRWAWPRFLKLSMLECGTPIILNSPGYVLRDNVAAAEFAPALDHVLKTVARRTRMLLVVVRDFETEAAAQAEAFRRIRYTLVPSLPNTYMPLRWANHAEYVQALKSYYRSKQLKHVKRIEALGVRAELTADFAAHAEQLCRQWLVVHAGASEFQREVLTPDFYRGLAEQMQGNAKVWLFWQGDELLGHALMLQDGALMRWLYFGRMQAANDSLYLYTGHKVVQAAIESGCSELELGLTTYPVKQDVGAEIEPITLAITAVHGWLNPLIGLVYPLLNRIPAIEEKQVFRTQPQQARSYRHKKKR